MGTTVLEIAVYRKRPAERQICFFLTHHSTILNFCGLAAGPSIRFHFDSGAAFWHHRLKEWCRSACGSGKGTFNNLLFKLRWSIWNLWREKESKTRRSSQNRGLYRRNIKKVERIISLRGPPLDQRHQWIAWLPGLWRVCLQGADCVFKAPKPSSSPEDRISRSIWVISLSSSIDLRRSAGLSISLSLRPWFMNRSEEQRTPGRKTWNCIASSAPPTDNLTIDGVEIVNQWHFRRARLQRTSLR